MATIDDFSRLVSATYAAALTPEHWDVAIAETHSMFDGTHGSLFVADGVNRSVKTSSVVADRPLPTRSITGALTPSSCPFKAVRSVPCGRRRNSLCRAQSRHRRISAQVSTT
jgi:hypothetical protein